MSRLDERLKTLLRPLDYSEAERNQLIRLMLLLANLPAPPDAERGFPKYQEYKQKFLTRAEGEDSEALEEAFLTLYAHLHMHEGRYTPEERKQMDEAGGYWAHAGGLSPILEAAPWIRPNTVSADLGAGNGLQGLLLQILYPHRKTIQIEISSNMVELGKQLQAWLGIPPAGSSGGSRTCAMRHSTGSTSSISTDRCGPPPTRVGHSTRDWQKHSMQHPAR